MAMRIILLAAALVAACWGYPSGAPDTACSSRLPGHGAAVQTAACPFEVAGLFWTPGEYTTMGIYPKAGFTTARFKGLLVSVFDKSTGEPIGQMRTTADTNRTSVPANPNVKPACSGTSLTHADRLNQEELYFEWFAPATLTATAVELRLTVVQDFATYWVDCNSIDLPVRQAPAGGAASSSTSSSSTTTAAPVQARTQPPTLPPTLPPTQPPTLPPTEPPTQPPTLPPTEPPTLPPTQPPTTRRPTTVYVPPTTRRPTTVYVPPTTTRPTTVYVPPPTTTVYVPPTTRRQTTVYVPPTTRRPTTVYVPPTTRRQTTVYVPPTTRRSTTVYVPPTTRRQTTVYVPPTTRRPTTVYVPPTTRRQTTVYVPPTTRRQTTVYVPPPTTRRVAVQSTTRKIVTYPAPSNTGQDSYLDYAGKANLKHKTMSTTECMEYGNFYRIKPNTDCREYIQSTQSGAPGYPVKCPGSTKFDPRACTCAFTLLCPLP